MSHVGGPASVSISRVGGFDPVSVDATNLACSWMLSGVGTLSAFVPYDEIVRRSLVRPLLGRWVRYVHPTAGPWFGRIIDERGGLGEVELACESGASLLRRRRTLRRQNIVHGPPAALAAAAVRDAMRDDPLWIVSAWGDEAGPPIAYEHRAADVLDDVLPSLPCEWTVDEDRRFTAARRIGADRQDVLLVEGHHVVAFDEARSLFTVENDLLGITGEDVASRATTVQMQDDDSVRAYGRLQGSRDYNAVTNPGGLYGYVQHELARTKDPAWTANVTIVDEGHVYARFREGDAVRLILETARFDGRFRVTARALNMGDGTMTLSGELGEWTSGGVL